MQFQTEFSPERWRRELWNCECSQPSRQERPFFTEYFKCLCTSVSSFLHKQKTVLFYLGALWAEPRNEGPQSQCKPSLAGNEGRFSSPHEPSVAHFAGRVKGSSGPISHQQRVKTCLLPRGYRMPGTIACIAKHIDSAIFTTPCVVLYLCVEGR